MIEFKRCFKIVAEFVLLLGACQVFAAAQSEVWVWETLLRPRYFKDIEIIEGNSVMELKTPYRAEDAALTPVSINAKIPQTEALYIKKIHVFVDQNPQPLVGTFELSPHIPKADLAMRVRIDRYTYIRAIAELSNGEHHMAARYVKAQGGCSAPLAADLKAALQRMGKMKFRTVGEVSPGKPALAQFMLSHPNITGMQLDQRTRAIIPEHYVKEIVITYNDQPILKANIGISISADPSLRFFFTPGKEGLIKAQATDSKGMQWSETYAVKGSSAKSDG